MNHKRKRPKNTRAGCLMCKPHKRNGCHQDKHTVKKQLVDGDKLEDYDPDDEWDDCPCGDCNDYYSYYNKEHGEHGLDIDYQTEFDKETPWPTQTLIFPEKFLQQ